MLQGVWSSGLRAVGQPPEGEAHGANSCRGEMLTPLNAPSSKQRWAEHMPMGERGWVRGEEGDWGDPADAVEKGELTPVKWLIKVWCSPFWGANGVQDSNGNSKPSLATERGARHKPQTGSLRFRRYFYWPYLHRQNTLHTWNAEDRCFYFHCRTQRLSTQSLFCVMTGGTGFSRHTSIHLLRPQMQSIQTHVRLLSPHKLINEVHSVKPLANHWSSCGFPCSQGLLGSGRNRCDIYTPLLSLGPSYPPSLPLLLVKQSIFHL